MRSGLRLAATAAFLSMFASTPASAENRTTIQIATVLASNQGRAFDARLSNLKNELRQLRFRSYRLISSEIRVLRGNGGQSGMELPHGRYLHITTREHTPDHLRLHILLNEDNRPVVNTYVKLELGSVVLLGGPRDQDGTLVITIASRPYREDEDQDEPKKPMSQSTPPQDAPQDQTSRELPATPASPPAPAVSAVAPVCPGN